MKILSLIRTVLCLVGLFAIGQWSYQWYTAQKATTQKTIALVKQTKTDRQDRVVHTNTPGDAILKAEYVLNINDVSQDLTQLKTQAERVVTALEKETVMTEHDKNNLIARTKEAISQIEHLDKYIQKGPSSDRTPELASNNSETIYREAIERKSLAVAHKLETIITEFMSEVTEPTVEKTPSPTLTDSITHNANLLKHLVI